MRGTFGEVRLPIQALLFDADGTLIDSTPAVVRTWTTWANHRGIDIDQVLAICHGRRPEDTVARFLPPDQHADAVAELIAMDLADLDGVIALPGALDLLESLPTDRWAVVTSASRDLARARFAAAGLPTPPLLIGADDVVHGKPDPEGYLAAAAHLGFPASTCLVVEDAPAGLQAGHASGATTLAVLTTHTAADLQLASHIVSGLADVTVSETPDGLSMTLEPR